MVTSKIQMVTLSIEKCIAFGKNGAAFFRYRPLSIRIDRFWKNRDTTFSGSDSEFFGMDTTFLEWTPNFPVRTELFPNGDKENLPGANETKMAAS